MATLETRKVYNSPAHREAQRRARNSFPRCKKCGRFGRLEADHITPLRELRDGGAIEARSVPVFM